MSIVLTHLDGEVIVEELEGGSRRLTARSSRGAHVPIASCETTYSISLIELILEIKGPEYVCDEICRDIDPTYVRADLYNDLSGYFAPEDLLGKRILDFGCGSGASSMVLSRLYPDSQIVGIELSEDHLRIARARLEHYGYTNIEFVVSPSGSELAQNVGVFDLVILSAVFEHLLPAERTSVIPQVWASIRPDGYLFLNMTPHRWFPVEHHTTGLPLLNYLPDSLALPFARKFSNRIDKTEPWDMLLRRGIRGATEGEVMKIISNSSDQKPKLLEPAQQGLKDRIDLWYSQLNHDRHVSPKKMIRSGMKILKAVTGSTMVPNLSLVIQKSA